jgi:hypothetical protein
LRIQPKVSSMLGEADVVSAVANHGPGGRFVPRSKALMGAADSNRKSNYCHFLNHLECLTESHRPEIRALSHLQESAHVHLERSRHEASGEPTTPINGTHSLGGAAAPTQIARTATRLVANQLRRAVVNRLGRRQRFRTPLREAADSPEIHLATTAVTLESSAFCAHSKGGEAC